MSQPPILWKEPRKLTLLEIVDIHIMVMQSRPRLRPPCKTAK